MRRETEPKDKQTPSARKTACGITKIFSCGYVTSFAYLHI